jgi:molybdate transport system ATP-binding protein
MDLSFEATGGTIGIFGPSGSGKTTLLRAMAGLLRADSAKIRFADVIWEDAEVFVPTHERRIGYVFQESSLFPHLTVRQNIEYGRNPALGDLQKTQIDVSHVVQLFEIDGLLDRSVDQLSGGEQQRVALARALAAAPELLLLDEPLSALDVARKQEILPFLSRLKTEYSIPMLYVSHAADELALLADHLLVLEDGRIHTDGEIQKTYPLLGSGAASEVQTAVLLAGQLAEIDSEWQLGSFQFPGGTLQIRANNNASWSDSLRVRVQARDVSISLTEDVQSSILNRLAATVTSLSDAEAPGMTTVTATVADETGSSEFLAQITKKSAADLGLEVGRPVILQIKSVALLG